MYAYFREGEIPKVESLYPATVIKARYGGCYEGGAWLAFNCDSDEVPRAVWGCDMECSMFFTYYNEMNAKQRRKNPLKIGRGDTPDEALKDLVAQYHVTSSD